MPVNWLAFGLDHAVFFCVARALLRAALPARRASDPWRRAGARVAALAFGIHPLRVESVARVTERRDVLSSLFYLLAVWAYLRYVARRAATAYWAALGCFALALMSKSITASLPCSLVLLDIYPLGCLGGASRSRSCPSRRLRSPARPWPSGPSPVAAG